MKNVRKYQNELKIQIRAQPLRGSGNNSHRFLLGYFQRYNEMENPLTRLHCRSLFLGPVKVNEIEI